VIDPVRQELLSNLMELSELVPEVRFGQLVTNLSYLARGALIEATWDVEDDELLPAAKKQLAYFRETRTAPA
jgi:hypothetical protein